MNRRPLIMTKDGKVSAARVKISATEAYTVDGLRGKVGEYHKLVTGSPSSGLAERLYLNGFLNWLENPAEFLGEG